MRKSGNGGGVMGSKVSRRQVLKLAGALPFISLPSWKSNVAASPEATVRLGVIGFGIRGEQLMRALGFATPQWIERVKGRSSYDDYVKAGKLNVVVNGICDLFDARAENALVTAGEGAKRYRDYREMLVSKDIDAVIIATPDHMHAPMIIDAARAGKHVYVEKCMTHSIGEVQPVYDAVTASGIVFQLGHQLRQKDTVAQARDLLNLDVLGKVTLVETSSNRNSPNAAWVYDIPETASEKNIDWKQFDAERPFDADRFFRWRKYWDYGTGLSGDLLTHEFDSLNYIMEMGIPHAAMASGGIYYYNDGREVPDVFNVVFEFPDKQFSMLYSATLGNDDQRPTLIMGHDATMKLDNKLEVVANRGSTKYQNKFDNGIMTPDEPFYVYPSDEHPVVPVDVVSSATSRYFAAKGMMTTIVDGKPVDPTRLHLLEWLLCIENGWQPSCDIEAGYAEAVAAHMATLSYKSGRKIVWDAQKRTIVK